MDVPHPSIQELRNFILNLDGPEGLYRLKKVFENMDRSKDNLLDFFEFWVGLKRYGMEIARYDARAMFMSIDKNNSGRIDFAEFLRVLGGELPKHREQVVMNAFRKIDKHSVGVVTADDIASHYNVAKHPAFRRGEASAADILERFLGNFEGPSTSPHGTVSLEEFLAYFADLSDRIKDDQEFDAIVRDAFR